LYTTILRELAKEREYHSLQNLMPPLSSLPCPTSISLHNDAVGFVGRSVGRWIGSYDPYDGIEDYAIPVAHEFDGVLVGTGYVEECDGGVSSRIPLLVVFHKLDECGEEQIVARELGDVLAITVGKVYNSEGGALTCDVGTFVVNDAGYVVKQAGFCKHEHAVGFRGGEVGEGSDGVEAGSFGHVEAGTGWEGGAAVRTS